MSEKYEKMAREFWGQKQKWGDEYVGADLNAIVYEIVVRAMRFCAEKLAEERARETCETCKDSAICMIWTLVADVQREGDLPFSCSWWKGRPVEPQSVVAPTSAGGTVKSPAVTPDEGAHT